jgi:hypothetical protein
MSCARSLPSSGEFYAVRYMFMAKDILNAARARNEIANKADRPSSTIATSSERTG